MDQLLKFFLKLHCICPNKSVRWIDPLPIQEKSPGTPPGLLCICRAQIKKSRQVDVLVGLDILSRAPAVFVGKILLGWWTAGLFSLAMLSLYGAPKRDSPPLRALSRPLNAFAKITQSRKRTVRALRQRPLKLALG